MPSMNHPHPTVQSIQVLDEQVANLIAAGEVVERPASVIKELIENALDAGAHDIQVELEKAGFELIRVADDGSGMDAADARLSFVRHATSKLHQAEDLHTIRTYGFRGEALPSIAAVAKVELVTRRADREAGVRLRIAGGTETLFEAAGCSTGTTVSVRELFFNTPARKKFMKTPGTEQSRAIEVVEWAAMSRPDVGFRLRIDGREQFNCPPTDSLQDRLAGLFGDSLPEPLLVLRMEEGQRRLAGFASGPEHTRATRQGMKIFVNGRPVEHRGLAYAILEGYHPLLPAGRFPTVFLFLEVPTEEVDVNVHPAKREVRFRAENEVRELIKRALRQVMDQHPAAFWSGPGSTGQECTATEIAGPRPGVQQALRTYFDRQENTLGRPGPYPTRLEPSTEGREAGTDYAGVEPSRILGQAGDAYLVAQDAQGLLIIDQHAAHERMLYERFRARTGPLARQALLLPLTLTLTADRADLLEELRPYFAEAGFEISRFGDRTFAVQTRPDLWEQGDVAGMVEEVLDRAQSDEPNPVPSDLFDRLYQSMACHAAIKAGDRLVPETQAALLRGITSGSMPQTCPHGRPFVLRIPWEELRRRFKRT